MFPEKCAVPALEAVLAGNVDVSVGFHSSISGQCGKVVPWITVGSEKVLEGVPTVVDKGIDGVANSGTMHRVVLVNRDVPADVLAKLRKAFADMQGDKTYQNLLKKLGENAVYMDGGAYEAVRQEQSEKYKAFAASLAK